MLLLAATVGSFFHVSPAFGAARGLVAIVQGQGRYVPGSSALPNPNFVRPTR